jgi:hypothetical protein
MLVAGGLQVAIWRFGAAAVRPPLIVAMAVGLALLIGHTFALKRFDAWFAFSELPPIAWLGGAPWLSSTALVLLALAAYARLERVGIRIKASSEAHL